MNLSISKLLILKKPNALLGQENEINLNFRLAYSTIDKIIYVTFRGSKTTDNWITDFDFLLES